MFLTSDQWNAQWSFSGDFSLRGDLEEDLELVEGIPCGNPLEPLKMSGSILLGRGMIGFLLWIWMDGQTGGEQFQSVEVQTWLSKKHKYLFLR